MKKEELINKISATLSAADKEITVAFDVFLQKVAELLGVNESIRIPEIGIFQLKKRKNGESDNAEKSSFFLLFVPLKYDKRDLNEVLVFQVNPQNKEVHGFDDSVFSISVDKPLIPISGQKKNEFLVQSSYIMLQKSFEDKVDSLLSKSIQLNDFNIDYNPLVLSNDVKKQPVFNSENDTEPSLTESETEHIAWNFGTESGEPETFGQDNDDLLGPESVFDTVANLEKDENDNTTDEVDINVIDSEISGDLSDNFGIDENITELKQEPGMTDPLSANSLLDLEMSLQKDVFDDWVKTEADVFSDTPGNISEAESLPETEQTFDFAEAQIDGLDNKLDMLIDMEGDQALDPFIENPDQMAGIEENDLVKDETEIPNVGIPEEEPDSMEEAGIPMRNEEGVNPLLDADDEQEAKEKLSPLFWAVLALVILITAGGVYYFLGSKKTEQDALLSAQNGKSPKPAQVIQRDYDVPVTVIPNNSDNKEKETISKTPDDKTTEPPATEEKKTGSVVTETIQADNSKTNQGNGKETDKNNTAVTRTPQKKVEVAEPTSVPLRSDTKDKLVREFIFSDGSRFTIQESSWATKTEADKRVRHFRGEGYDAYVTKYAPKNGKTWFRVRIGDYSSLEEAQNILKRLDK